MKNVISSLLQGLWTPNLAGWRLRMRKPPAKSRDTLNEWLRDKSKIFLSHGHKTQGPQT